MTTIDIRLIRPSPNPIRKTWDEDKMQELAASIKERGVIVPIKVRPVEGLKPCPNEAHITKFGGGQMPHGFNVLLGDTELYDLDCEFCYLLYEQVYVDPNGEFDDPEEDEDGRKIPVVAPFEIVYGHRRAEAARRAGLEEVPVIIETTNDTDALIEALIENVQREDMNPLDEARAIKALMDATKWSTHEIGRRGIMKQQQASARLLLLEESPEIQALITSPNPGVKVTDDQSLGVRHVIEVRGAGLDQSERTAVLLKASGEQLTRHETRAVADAYKAAPTPELKDAVLNTSGKLGDADRILQVAQMNIGAAGLVERNEQERRQAFEDYDRAVKDFLDAMKLFDRMLKTARDAARYGKFSPEGARFAVGRIDKLIDELETLKETLSNVE